jgi:hypothetical protein
MALFSLHSEHFENRAKFDPLITPPHWEAFGPPKDYLSLREDEGIFPSPFQPQSNWPCLDLSL